VNFFSGSQILFNFIFSKNIQSQTEKSQNSLTPALHHGYCTFSVHHGTNFVPAFVEVYINQVFAFCCENGEVCFSDKWKANERFKAWIAADPKSRTKVKCTVCDKAINIWSMGNKCAAFLDQFFCVEFLVKLNVTSTGCVALRCVAFCCFCCFVASSCVVLWSVSYLLV